MSKKMILLACGTGMSTTMLVKKIKKIVQDQELNYDFHACSMDEANAIMDQEKVDVLLLGPQVAYMENSISKARAPQGINVGVINKDDYGLANGKNVLTYAETLL